ncbi:MAG: 6-pyruvoyl tetrahydropterin synthase [Holophagales bacterium]|nr:6-pyruvoyl tetrahydropterin synthase [Holophagales bacterium]MYH24383.1 6-pyruvoyl tetrahydropterin synthase [Holophagales bacterium]
MAPARRESSPGAPGGLVVQGRYDRDVSGTYSLRLSKEDFKFSAAHFTVFSEDEAEALHGHNYRVRVELGGPGVDELEFLVPVAAAKRDIRSQCAELDEKVLLPEGCPYLELTRSDETVTTRFGTRRYEFPSSEVVLLPVANVTVEALARLFWQRLADRWGSLHDRVETLEVIVAETRGQGASYRRDL